MVFWLLRYVAATISCTRAQTSRHKYAPTLINCENPMHDYLIFIGRFQPFHNAHLRMVRSALARGKRLILLIGTADAPRSARNPWTFAEREAMVRAALTPDENAHTTIRPLHDDPYHDERWTAQVAATVAAVLAEHGTPEARVGLFGHEKDATSFYLRLFPQWDYLAEADTDGISATPIRRRYLLLGDDEAWDEPRLPPAVAAILQDFRTGDAYRRVAAEARYVEDYKQAWAAAPYPPIFVTVDALVICREHALVVRRGGQPGHGLLALPGGFLNPDEKLHAACLRELEEETGLQLTPDAISAVFTADKPDRSAIGRVITQLHIIRLDGEPPAVKGMDDAAAAFWLPLTELRREQFHDDHYYLIRDHS